MIYYELKIESSEETIEINEPNMINFADISLDTLNDDAQKKSNAILARMSVKGKIEASINDALIKISEWTRDLKEATTYRKVTLTVKSDETGVILRTYEIPNMFVCDYREVYGAPENEDGTYFVLKLTQKENQLKNFNTY